MSRLAPFADDRPSELKLNSDRVYLWNLKKVDNSAKECLENVEHPNYYTAGGIECIDAVHAVTKNLIGMECVCTANVLKYIWRWKLKNGVEDLKKAKWYLEYLIDYVEGDK